MIKNGIKNCLYKKGGMIMVDIKVGSVPLSAQQLNTLRSKQPEHNEKQSVNLYQDTVRPLYYVQKPTVHEHDILGNKEGSSYASSYAKNFDVNHSLKYPMDPKPTINAEHIFVDSIVRK